MEQRHLNDEAAERNEGQRMGTTTTGRQGCCERQEHRVRQLRNKTEAVEKQEQRQLRDGSRGS